MRWGLMCCLSVATLCSVAGASAAAAQVGLTTGRGGYVLTLHAVHRAALDTPAGDEPVAPLDYVNVEVSVQNWSAEPGSYAASDFLVRDHVHMLHPAVPRDGEPYPFGEGALEPGTTRWGRLTFLVPVVASDLRLEYRPPPLRAEGTTLTLRLEQWR